MINLLLYLVILLGIGYVFGRANIPVLIVGGLMALIFTYLFVWDNYYMWGSLYLEYSASTVAMTRWIVSGLSVAFILGTVAVGSKIGQRAS